MHKWVQENAKDSTYVMSVCTGPHKGSEVTITTGAAKSADRTEIEWKFTDNQGRPWQGSAMAEASTQEKGKSNLTVRLARR